MSLKSKVCISPFESGISNLIPGSTQVGTEIQHLHLSPKLWNPGVQDLTVGVPELVFGPRIESVVLDLP